MNSYHVDKSLTLSSDSNQLFTIQRPYPQGFSIAYPIIKYMIEDPKSPKAWKKLLETCKYFYSKKPVLPIYSLHWSIDNNDSKIYVDDELFKQPTTVPKLWVTFSFSVFEDRANVSSLIPKISICDVRNLTLGKQNLTWDAYQKLTSSGSVENLVIVSCNIRNSDGTFVTADKLFENFHTVENIYINCSNKSIMFKPDTVKKMVLHLTRFKKLYSFKLYGIPESFDFITFKDYLLKNNAVDMRLIFTQHVSDVYKEKVKRAAEDIYKSYTLKHPYIEFFGQD